MKINHHLLLGGVYAIGTVAMLVRPDVVTALVWGSAAIIAFHQSAHTLR